MEKKTNDDTKTTTTHPLPANGPTAEGMPHGKPGTETAETNVEAEKE